MHLNFIIAVFCLIFVQTVLCDQKIVRAKFESCPGCSLNRLPEVRAFFYEDIPRYENVEWKKIGGAPPEVIFLDENDGEVERHLLGKLSRKECNELMEAKGFQMSPDSVRKDKEL